MAQVKQDLFEQSDVEKDAVSVGESSYAQKDWHNSYKWSRKLLQWGLETRGAQVDHLPHSKYIHFLGY